MLYYAAAGSNIFTEVSVSIPIINSATSDRVLESTISGLNEGVVYRVYVVAVNQKGRSPPSPYLSVVAATLPGMDSAATLTYNAVIPRITSIDSTQISLTWALPGVNSTGGSPITGYRVYMFPGIGLNTYANPHPVLKEVQQVSTSVDPQLPAIQKVSVFGATGGTYRLFVFGEPTIVLSAAASSSSIAAALRVALFQSTAVNATIDVSPLDTSVANTVTFTVTFSGYDGPVPLIVVDISNLLNSLGVAENIADANHQVTYSVTSIQEGSQAISGSFTLSFNHSRTVDVPYDVSAADLKAALEDLPGIGIVSVTRVNGTVGRGDYTWFITFETLAGDLPLMYATAGRLSPLSSHASITVTEVTAGSISTLVYDGTGIPDVRSVTISNLISDMTYAFKVTPINAIGEGVLSGASTTVAATSGASAVYTTVSGSAVVKGITGDVDEQQIITAYNCKNSSLYLFWGGNKTMFHAETSGEDLTYILNSHLKVKGVSVQRTADVNASQDIIYWRVTFENMGDVAPLVVVSLNGSCNVSVTEFIKGEMNEFTIEPKKANGDVLRDVTTYAAFRGEDIFLTETYVNGVWFNDNGIATYNPQVYEVVGVFFPTAYVHTNVILSLPDYLTPQSTVVYNSGSFNGTSSPYDVQLAIEKLANVDSVDVTSSSDAHGTVWMITFLSNLGDVPLPMSSNIHVGVWEIVSGVCEVQTITIAADDTFTREEQIVTITYSGSAVGQSFALNFPDSLGHPSPLLNVDSSASQVEAAFDGMITSDGAPVIVSVSKAAPVVSGGQTTVAYAITFIDPVGDVPELVVTNTTAGVTFDSVEGVKGKSPIKGSFTILYEGEFSNDINFDASAAAVKQTLEAMSKISTVKVDREDTGNGYKWTVSFTKNVGNLRMMLASDYRYEIQLLETFGGSPTPLSGFLQLSMGNDSVTVSYDATADELAAALESLPSVGAVQVSNTLLSNGRSSWLITYRGLVGNVPNLGVTYDRLFGSNAFASVKEVVAGSSATLSGSNPRLAVNEKVSGKPDYTGKYFVPTPGPYELRVKQLVSGGLRGQYFDNQWFYGAPSVDRIDPTVNFYWGTGLVTEYSHDYVSVRWSGKLRVDKTEEYTLYILADDGARVFLNHSLLIDAWDVASIEYRAQVSLTANVYYDLVIEYQELTGSARVIFSYGSTSVKKQVVPSANLYNSLDVVGSPFSTVIVPGAAEYPFTDAYGLGLSLATTGTPASFRIQVKDSMGNNMTVDYEQFDPADLLSVKIYGGAFGKTIYYAGLTYLGEGLFEASYLPLSAGAYNISIQMGGRDIFCGRGEAHKCSPFPLTVVPGPTVPMMSEVESPSFEVMDYLVEAVAGESGYFFIQAKDAYGNNQIVGGDDFRVLFTLQTDIAFQYRGNVQDHGDGTYTVRYTIPQSGYYTVSVTLQTSEGVVEPIQTCIASHSPYIYNRVYDGVQVYHHPSTCSLNTATLHVVHNDLDAPSSTYNDGPQHTLASAITGVQNQFTIEARDEFGNLRHGDATTHFIGYGDGLSDYFLVEFTNPVTQDYVRVSSAIDVIQGSSLITAKEFFRLSFGGKTTYDIPIDISAQGLETILEELHNFQLQVSVTKSVDAAHVSWTVEFLTMLNIWSSRPPAGLPNGGQLTVLAPMSGSKAFFNSLSIFRPHPRGIYPVSFPLWTLGKYDVRISNNGIDIAGSPTSIIVTNAPVDPTASVVFGSGLHGGVAGDQLTVYVQAKDTRQTEVQSISTSAFVTNFVLEIQQITIQPSASDSYFKLNFAGNSIDFTVSSSIYSDITAGLTKLNIGTFTITDQNGASISSSKTLSAGDIIQIHFATTGNIPELVSSAPSVATVTEIRPGDAPFRKEIQTLVCTASSGSFTLSLNDVQSGVISSTFTLDQVASALSNISVVTVTGTGVSTVCSSSALPIYIQFESLKGDVNPLVPVTSGATLNNVFIYTTSSWGAQDGVFPLWGTFTLGFKGEVTAPLSYDAAASEVEAALEALYSVGDVTVVKDNYGIPYGPNGVTPFYMNGTNLFSIWTVYFNAVCTGNAHGVASGKCPASLGQEPLFVVNSDNIFYSKSPYYHQERPIISVSEVVKGYGGNNRMNYDDIHSVGLKLQLRTNPAVNIGINEVQILSCIGGSTGNFTIQFMNDTIFMLDASLSVAMAKTVIQNSLSPGYTVHLNGSSPTICSAEGSQTWITFDTPRHALPSMVIVDVKVPMHNLSVSIFPYVEAVDSISLVPGLPGLYRLDYTPTIYGLYDIFVTINGQDVSNDLTAGVYVTPALEYGPTSTHNISQVTRQGVPEYYAVQFRDRFGNSLVGGLSNTSRIMLSMEGNLDSCQNDNTTGKETTSIPISVLPNAPYTDGIYSMSYTPTAAGSYILSTKLLTQGGLLGTYFRRQNLSDPVLASWNNVHDGLYHDPYWCDGQQLFHYFNAWAESAWDATSLTYCDPTIVSCGCDSTKLDTSLDFNWGTNSPLPYDDLFNGGFPSDFFSVKWSGYLTAPATGIYSIIHILFY